MFVQETRCDLCGKPITQNGSTLIGALKLKYKAKRTYEKKDVHCSWSRWESVDICPGCLNRIIKVKEETNDSSL